MSIKPFSKVAKNPTESTDIYGTTSDTPVLPIQANSEFSRCICRGTKQSSDVIQCKSCGAKCHPECYKLKTDQQQFFTCIYCQNKMVEAVLTQIKEPLDILQKSVDEISSSFDKLANKCEKLVPDDFESPVTIEKSQALHSSLCSLIGEASSKWGTSVTQMKRIHKIASQDLFLGHVPCPPHDTNE